MIFIQLFAPVSSTYTYLLAERQGGEALLIDPVLERADQYVRLVEELDLRLVLAMDTHIHADHVTALGTLRERTDCATAMGDMARAECVTVRYREGEKLCVDGLCLDVLYTPGHTDDSYSFVLANRVFTGDTLLIRGTGRTDFQNGDPAAQYDSLFGRLLQLPDDVPDALGAAAHRVDDVVDELGVALVLLGVLDDQGGLGAQVVAQRVAGFIERHGRGGRDRDRGDLQRM